MTVNASSIVQLAIQIKNGITVNVNVSVKSIVHAENITVGILAHVVLKIVSILKILLIIQKLNMMKL